MAHYNSRDLIKRGEAILAQHDEPVVGAKYLMMDLFNLSQMDILMGDKVLTDEEYAIYFNAIQQLAQHIPLAHITGFQMFYDRKFNVTKDVLVPRNETEELVQLVIQKWQQRSSFVDIGTGSGAIAVTLALELPRVTSYAVDISHDALEVARSNAKALAADVTFMQGDLLQPLIERDIKVDCLVSNPPYIAESERDLMNDSALHDPYIALFADDGGLALYKRMLNTMHQILNPGALVAFEIGHAQGKAISEYVQQLYPHNVPTIVQDINGLDRIVWFEWCE
ncbi:peptide chain release factor N(5)-glutamine methyltransferase [Macrococcus capreoli]|uniref:peptide chain release factor N(5)-glutamine methyltransferase n=1 Tax=Macrococcus capreoli TaxID=2982690 RepID=UPI0021D5F173|nr:peptide chain release factor N(5)-glutamine methyltransferase [Macrococcus sp. TMW 2.2395]MCU7558117.1 peptide chain release factor N(5)-glutamine methyltransferase [Macrococcus sp. TMW 2.2395]